MDIFLSSTAEDLAEHRLAVTQAVEQLELTCVGQETFTADQRRTRSAWVYEMNSLCLAITTTS